MDHNSRIDELTKRIDKLEQILHTHTQLLTYIYTEYRITPYTTPHTTPQLRRSKRLASRLASLKIRQIINS
jgi:hypothetical protein